LVLRWAARHGLMLVSWTDQRAQRRSAA